jgi:hypothetical protein
MSSMPSRGKDVPCTDSEVKRFHLPNGYNRTNRPFSGPPNKTKREFCLSRYIWNIYKASMWEVHSLGFVLDVKTTWTYVNSKYHLDIFLSYILFCFVSMYFNLGEKHVVTQFPHVFDKSQQALQI